MLFSKRILVVLDSNTYSRNALVRAHLIAERMGCDMELIWVGRTKPWLGLDDEMRVLESSAIAFSREVVSSDLIEAIRERWQQDHFGLLVKGCDPRHDSISLLAPRDWKLLRYTPCPVLLVKRDQSWADGRILAAVNPVTSKIHQHNHNQSILMIAGFIARELEVPLHTVIATPAIMQGAEPELQSQARIDEHAELCAKSVLSHMHQHVDKLHIGEGPPEYWIPQVSAEIEASLVVIGTHARKGVSGALLGNTAERILDQLKTDILVLRAGLSETLAPLVASLSEAAKE